MTPVFLCTFSSCVFLLVHSYYSRVKYDFQNVFKDSVVTIWTSTKTACAYRCTNLSNGQPIVSKYNYRSNKCDCIRPYVVRKIDGTEQPEEVAVWIDRKCSFIRFRKPPFDIIEKCIIVTGTLVDKEIPGKFFLSLPLNVYSYC